VLEKDQRTLILKIPIDNWQQNRRAFFRGDMEVQIFAIKSDGTRLHGRTANLSGGGALIALDGPLVMHEVIQLVLEFGRDESISVKAQVVRVDKKKDSELYGMKFLDLSSRDQNTVCRIVLVEEFENRRAEIRELTQRSGNR
jgi:c-di-GMP-binding flagellar brake protein YcgR